MSNKIVIDDYGFDDESIISANMIVSNSMIGDQLSIDEIEFEITSEAELTLTDSNAKELTDENDLSLSVFVSNNNMRFDTGSEIEVYKDDVLFKKFYCVEHTRIDKHIHRIKGQSMLGLLSLHSDYYGGVYSNISLEDLIDDILEPISGMYSVTEDVATETVTGALVPQSRISALQQLLFVQGLSIITDSDGDMVITYNQPDEMHDLSDDNVAIGGSQEYTTPVTAITVVEHSFIPSQAVSYEAIMDNHEGGTASEQTIILEQPYHSIYADTAYPDLTFEEVSPYVYNVTGYGILYGKPYIHTTRELTERTDVSGDENVKIIKDATLVSSLNITNVIERAKSFYSKSNEVKCTVKVIPGVKSGELVGFTDPWDEVKKTGIVQSMEVSISGEWFADTKIITDWIPSNLGNGYNAYSEYGYDGSFTVPNGCDHVRLILIGGGQGGSGGGDGEKGAWEDYSTFQAVAIPGGAGGSGGVGGKGGKVSISDVQVSSGTIISIVVGSGGAGGSHNSVGSLGTETTATINGDTYSSGNGSSSIYGYRNPINGDIRGVSAPDGLSGADGSQSYGALGQSYTYNGTTWSGGSGGSGYQGYSSDYPKYSGAGGGGAAYGVSGGDASGVYGTTPGAGASPLSYVPNQQYYGDGGIGGNGGGGGGFGSRILTGKGVGWDTYKEGGAGGVGSNGQNGANGCAIILYKI